MRLSIPMLPLAALAAGFILTAAAPARAEPGRDAILADLAAQAKAADAGFAGFSAERGKALFSTRHAGGKPETPACTTCHTNDPRNRGKTRVGKVIEPMAVSLTPSRFTEARKVEKWFRRNCRSVLGRVCTPREKGDYITFMMSR
ncbi:MAG: DUF1924 domain-containing protein [Kiloniellaceae bacterium]